jgi:hypothetical protein
MPIKSGQWCHSGRMYSELDSLTGGQFQLTESLEATDMETTPLVEDELLSLKAARTETKKIVEAASSKPQKPQQQQKQKQGFCVSSLRASHVSAMDRSRRGTDGGLLKCGQSSKGSRAFASNA